MEIPGQHAVGTARWSTWGDTRSAIDAVFAATTVEDARAILGQTALTLFNVEQPRRPPRAARHGGVELTAAAGSPPPSA